VPADVLKVVVDSVHEDVARTSNLGCTSRNIVEVVVAQSDVVLVAVEEHGPVMVAIAGSRPGGLAIELIVRDCYLTGRIVASDDHLAANEAEFVVVDPDVVGANKRDGVTTPMQQLV